MITTEQKLKDIKSINETKTMKLADDSVSRFFKMFINNVYSNPIGSFIRELTSNCFDSHIEANVNDPIIVKLNKENNEYSISFIDFGVGISPERMNDIFSVLFNSTKRDTNDQIGGFGIGSKTPLAYKRLINHATGEYDNSYFIETVSDGIKYNYIIAEGNKSIPVYELMYFEKTDQKNGTEIRVPVLQKDINSLHNNIKKQLAYFDNIIFDGFDHEFNKYQIYDAEHFLFRPNNDFSALHVSLGKVAYPIDFEILDIPKNYLNVALKFNIGDLDVTDSRENLNYNDKTINAIKSKIELMNDELTGLLRKQNESVKTLIEYYERYRTAQYLTIDDHNLDLSYLNIDAKEMFINFKYFGKKVPAFDDVFSVITNQIKIFGKPNIRRVYIDQIKNKSYFKLDNLTEFTYYYTIDDIIININRNKYIKHMDKYVAIINLNSNKSIMVKDLISKIGFYNTDQSIDREQLEVFYLDIINDVYSYITSTLKNYNEVEPTQEFLNYLKEQRKANKKAYDKQAITLTTYNNNEKRTNMTVSELDNHSGLIVYGNTDETYIVHKITKIYNVLFDKQANQTVWKNGDYVFENCTIICSVSKANERHFKNIKNAIHVSEFKLKLFRRKYDLALTILADRYLYNKYHKDLEYFWKHDAIKKISKKFYIAQKTLFDFINTLNTSKSDSHLNEYVSDDDLNKAINKPELAELDKHSEYIDSVIKKNTKLTDDWIILRTYYFDDPEYIEFLKKVLVF